MLPFPSEGPPDPRVKRMPNVASSLCVGLGVGTAIFLLWQKQRRIAGFLRKLVYINGLSLSGFKTTNPVFCS